jgi:hypothetical protein
MALPKFTQLVQLVLDILPLIFRRHAGIAGDSRGLGKGSRCRKPSAMMRQEQPLSPKLALFVVDVQPSFPMPSDLVVSIRDLSQHLYTVATVERHDETVTPFKRQLGWKPGVGDESLVPADRVFIKHGYLPPVAAIDHLKSLGVERVLVCGI